MGSGLGHYVPLAIYLTGCICALLALCGRPLPSVYFLMLLIPMQTTRDRIGDFPLGEKMIDLLWIPVLVGLLLRGGTKVLPRSPMYRWLAAFGLLLYCSLWRGTFFLDCDLPLLPSDPRFSDWKNYLVMLMICITVAGAVRTKQQIQGVLLCIALGTALVDWSFFRSTAGRDFSHFAYELRDAGVLGYAGVNGFAAYIAQSIVFFASLIFFYKRKLTRPAVLVLLGFSVYCLLFAFSRGAYMAALAGLAFAALFRQRKVLVALVALVLCWQAVLPHAVQERITMTESAGSGSLEPSAGDRIVLWEDAMQLFHQNPVMGSGFDTYKYMHRVASYGDTHNYYVKVLVEMGLIGLLFFSVLLARMLWLGIELYRSTTDPFYRGLGVGFASLIVCAAVANFFGDRWTYLQVDGYIWVLMGCCMRAYADCRDFGPVPATAPAKTMAAVQNRPALEWEGA